MENKDDIDRLDIQLILQIVQQYLNINPEADVSASMPLVEEIYSKMKDFRARKHA